MARPIPGTYPEYYQRYIDQVAENDLTTALENQLPRIREFLSGITEEQSLFRYAPGKWTMKEVLQHMIDTERIFGYRSLCFARGEKASLPGFEEDDYAAQSGANSRTWQSLVEEMILLRQSTIILFNSFPSTGMAASGIANNNPISVLAMGFIIPGHFTHHRKVMEERYLGTNL
ncbi:MAG: DinB family protein [Chitinophagaceae bacterium]|nr:DinB family protein [Chitinophagaceae bacterium]